MPLPMFRGLAHSDLKVTLKIKDFFFDRIKVQRAIEKSRYRPMYRVAGMIRVTARRSMRKRKRASAAGTPPSRHVGEPNLQTIWFAWDPSIDGIVAGPLGFNHHEGAVPGVHEHGGELLLNDWAVTGTGATKRLVRKKRRARYPARPFMQPALEAVARKYPDLWHDAIKG